jgi:hypothetical protein
MSEVDKGTNVLCLLGTIQPRLSFHEDLCLLFAEILSTGRKQIETDIAVLLLPMDISLGVRTFVVQGR